jgi:hypothetical protein
MADDNEKQKARKSRRSRQFHQGENPRSNPQLSQKTYPSPENASLTAATIALRASFEPGAQGPRLAHRAVEPDLETADADDLDYVRLPPVTDVRCFNTTRLLPAKYSESVLTRIADTDTDLPLIFELENATNDRLLSEANLRLGITARELVFDVPYCRIINAAFTHPHPQGGRFSTPYRGAWYAGLELATAKAEVLFHRAIQFAEIGWQRPEELEYDQYTADFTGCFHDLRPPAFSRTDPAPCLQQEGAQGGPAALAVVERGRRQAANALEIQAAGLPATAEEFASCLALGSYIASQQLAIHLLDAGSSGILYPSARRAGGSCIACFRPSLVANVRKRDLYCLRWHPDRAATFVRSPRTPPSVESSAIAAQ